MNHTVATATRQVGVPLAGLATAMLVRGAVGGQTQASSLPAAGAFATVLVAAATLAGWRWWPTHPSLWAGESRRAVGSRMVGASWTGPSWWAGPSWRAVGLGLAGGAGLLGAALIRPGTVLVIVRPPLDRVGWWGALVIAVAVSEEVLLRGVLLDAVSRAAGPVAGAAVAAVAFAALHVPLYGWGAVPLDLAVGIWLGGLRLVAGSVAAPALAHSLADLGAPWLL